MQTLVRGDVLSGFNDKVIDITLEGKSSDIYRMTTPLTGTVKSLRKNVYHIQDRTSRITIVGDPRLEMSVKSEGILDIRPSQKKMSPSDCVSLWKMLTPFMQAPRRLRTTLAKQW
jgi:hypothetical protein